MDDLRQGMRVGSAEYGAGVVTWVGERLVGIHWEWDVSGTDRYGVHELVHGRGWADGLDRL